MFVLETTNERVDHSGSSPTYHFLLFSIEMKFTHYKTLQLEVL